MRSRETPAIFPVARKTGPGTLLAGLLLVAAAPIAGAADLTLRITHVRGADHHIVLFLYRGPQGFPEPKAAMRRLKLAADPDGMEARVAGLEPGRYAVLAYHDEDGDGEMDRFLGLAPSEGYGLSRDPEVLGPPAFEDCAFVVGPGDTAVEIRMRY